MSDLKLTVHDPSGSGKTLDLEVHYGGPTYPHWYGHLRGTEGLLISATVDYILEALHDKVYWDEAKDSIE